MWRTKIGSIRLVLCRCCIFAETLHFFNALMLSQKENVQNYTDNFNSSSNKNNWFSPENPSRFHIFGKTFYSTKHIGDIGTLRTWKLHLVLGSIYLFNRQIYYRIHHSRNPIPPNKFIVPDSRYMYTALSILQREGSFIYMKARTSPETNNKLRLS